MGDEPAADDVVQETLVRLLARGEGIRDPGRLDAWLRQVARNVIADHHRARARSPHPRPSDQLDALPASDEEPREPAWAQIAHCMEPLLDRLDEIDRQALRASDLGGRTQAAAAAQLGLSLSAMKARIRRARVRLRAELLGCCAPRTDAGGAISGFEPGARSEQICGEARGGSARTAERG